MLKTDITEIKRRLKKDKCLPSKVSGCCVGANKEILATFHSFFGNLEEGDQTKYLEIAGKVLSGTMGNNALELAFPLKAEEEGGAQAKLLALRDSDFEDKELKEEFFQRIIKSYYSSNEYVILMFHDVYDVITKTSDKLNLDESASSFDYVICVICPLEEAKPGLVYSHSEQVLKGRIRDWVVADPEVGFMFPCFTERETDIHSVLFHLKSPDINQEGFVNEVLGCEMVQTNEDKKEVFAEIITEALEDEEENVERLIYDIHESLRDMIETKVDVEDPETGAVTGSRVKKEDMEMSNSIIHAVLEENEVEEEKIELIQKAFQEEIRGNTSVDQIIDRKMLLHDKARRREEDLLLEIAELRKENEELKKKIAELSK